MYNVSWGNVSIWTGMNRIKVEKSEKLEIGKNCPVVVNHRIRTVKCNTVRKLAVVNCHAKLQLSAQS